MLTRQNPASAERLAASADTEIRTHGFYRHLGRAPAGKIDDNGDEILELSAIVTAGECRHRSIRRRITMLYLVSGASRSGKTIIARNTFRRNALPYMSLDWLVMAFTNGVPEYGIHDKLWPHEIARRFWSFFEAMIEGMLWDDVDYVIEGEAMLPELIAGLIRKHQDRIRIVFVGYTEIGVAEKTKLVKKFSDGENDWLTKEPDDYIRDHISNMVAYSKMIKAECEKHSLPYFDTSHDFLAATDRATAHLTGDMSG